jgi:hypothetical protein
MICKSGKRQDVRGNASDGSLQEEARTALSLKTIESLPKKLGTCPKATSPAPTPRASVLSQVPKSEAPGPPIFIGYSHFSRHLGHPP